MRPARLAIVIAVIFLILIGVFGLRELKNRQDAAKIDEVPTSFSGIEPTPAVAGTDNWREYKNLEYNYAFRYPRDWTVAQVLPTEAGTINQVVLTSVSGRTVVFSVIDNPHALNSAQMTDKFASSASAQVLDRSETKIRGFVAERSSGGESEDIVITKGTVTYRIFSSLGLIGEDKINYDKVLETYIFI